MSYKGTEAQTTFEYDAGNTITDHFMVLRIGDQTYPIQYKITGKGNRLASVVADVNHTSIIISLSAQSNGTFAMRLSPEVFDAENRFTAFADGVPTPIEIEEIRSESDRVIEFSFDAGTHEIKIVGDYLVPEFGAVIGLVAAIAIMSAILMMKRSAVFKS